MDEISCFIGRYWSDLEQHSSAVCSDVPTFSGILASLYWSIAASFGFGDSIWNWNGAMLYLFHVGKRQIEAHTHLIIILMWSSPSRSPQWYKQKIPPQYNSKNVLNWKLFKDITTKHFSCHPRSFAPSARRRQQLSIYLSNTFPNTFLHVSVWNLCFYEFTIYGMCWRSCKQAQAPTSRLLRTNNSSITHTLPCHCQPRPRLQTPANANILVTESFILTQLYGMAFALARKSIQEMWSEWNEGWKILECMR